LVIRTFLGRLQLVDFAEFTRLIFRL